MENEAPQFKTAAVALDNAVHEDLRRDSRTCTEADNLARHVIQRMESLSVKLRSLEDDIRKLWEMFDNLKDGETILGCKTKTEFCETKLHRTPRAIQYLLNGRTEPKPQEVKVVPNPHEQCSHAPESAPAPVSSVEHTEPVEDQPSKTTELSLEEVLDKLVRKIALQPYAYYAAKFAINPEKHSTELQIVECHTLEIWKQIIEIGTKKLAAAAVKS